MDVSVTQKISFINAMRDINDVVPNYLSLATMQQFMSDDYYLVVDSLASYLADNRGCIDTIVAAAVDTDIGNDFGLRAFSHAVSQIKDDNSREEYLNAIIRYVCKHEDFEKVYNYVKMISYGYKTFFNDDFCIIKAMIKNYCGHTAKLLEELYEYYKKKSYYSYDEESQQYDLDTLIICIVKHASADTFADLIRCDPCYIRSPEHMITLAIRDKRFDIIEVIVDGAKKGLLKKIKVEKLSSCIGDLVRCTKISLEVFVKSFELLSGCGDFINNEVLLKCLENDRRDLLEYFHSLGPEISARFLIYAAGHCNSDYYPLLLSLGYNFTAESIKCYGRIYGRKLRIKELAEKYVNPLCVTDELLKALIKCGEYDLCNNICGTTITILGDAEFYFITGHNDRPFELLYNQIASGAKITFDILNSFYNYYGYNYIYNLHMWKIVDVCGIIDEKPSKFVRMTNVQLLRLGHSLIVNGDKEQSYDGLLHLIEGDITRYTSNEFLPNIHRIAVSRGYRSDRMKELLKGVDALNDIKIICE